MSKTQIILILSLFLFLSIPGFAFSKERKVFLVGEGVDALSLFRLYEVHVLAKERVGYDLRRLKVRFYDGYSLREISICWYDYILDSIIPYHTPVASGGYLILNILKPGFIASWKRLIWFSKLKGETVWKNEKLSREAKAQGWEIYEMRPEEKKALDSLRGLKFPSEPFRPLKMDFKDRLIRVAIAIALFFGLFFKREKIPKTLRYVILVFSVISFVSAFLR